MPGRQYQWWIFPGGTGSTSASGNETKRKVGSDWVAMPRSLESAPGELKKIGSSPRRLQNSDGGEASVRRLTRVLQSPLQFHVPLFANVRRLTVLNTRGLSKA